GAEALATGRCRRPVGKRLRGRECVASHRARSPLHAAARGAAGGWRLADGARIVDGPPAGTPRVHDLVPRPEGLHRARRQLEPDDYRPRRGAPGTELSGDDQAEAARGWHQRGLIRPRGISPAKPLNPRDVVTVYSSTMLKDLRLAVRMLLQAKGWTAVVVVSLALGIGANTALFSAVNGLMLRTIPVKDPGTLVRLRTA